MATTKPIPKALAALTRGLHFADGAALRDALLNLNSANSTYNIAATGTNALTAFQLNSVLNEIDTAPSGAGVNLPHSTGMQNRPTQFCFVINNGANSVNVYGYPNSSDTINGTAGSTGISLSSGTVALFVSAKPGAWFQISGSGGGGGGVSSLNSLTGALSIAAGSNITVTPSGSTITIAATGGGGSSFPDYISATYFGGF